jgi:CarD family transcriptional regulator
MSQNNQLKKITKVSASNSRANSGSVASNRETVVSIDKKTSAAKDASNKALYKIGNYVVYPTHGVGKILAEETQTIGDIELRMLVISFEKDKMTLRVPMSRAAAAGLRPVSTAEQMKKVFVTLKNRARTSRGMWSRRAQEYETKINSGSIISIAEVVRDLHQNVDQSERSYSERMIYESALSRLVGELAACEGTDYKTANDKLLKLLRTKVAEAAEALKEAA